MLKYFDNDFFKFLLGFISIISISIIVILASRLYQENSKIEVKNQTVSAINKKNN